MSPLFPRNLLRPRLRVSVACPERAQASRAGTLCGSIFDPLDPSAALGISLADSRSPSGSLTPAETAQSSAALGISLADSRSPSGSLTPAETARSLGCVRDFACGLPRRPARSRPQRQLDPSAALGISLAASRSPSGSLTPAEQLNFTVFPAANYTRGFTAAVKERLRRCQKQPR